MRIFHAHPAGFHALDTPGVSAQQEDISDQALHCKIFVQSPYSFGIGFRNHRVICVLRDRSAGSDGS
jgi:hypothetical protein